MAFLTWIKADCLILILHDLSSPIINSWVIKPYFFLELRRFDSAWRVDEGFKVS